MGRKCSVANCRSNYTDETKATVYGFPLKNEDQLDLWLAALPNVIRKSDVTRFMGVCEKHWPHSAKMKSVRGKLVPATPPSVFPGCPSSFNRQTASSTSRNIDLRGISATARTRGEDEQPDFDARDIIREDFSCFVISLTEKFSSGLHIIEDDNCVRLLEFNSAFTDVEMNITNTNEFYVTAHRRHTKVSLRDLLGFQFKLQRWSQIENIISRTRNQALSSSSETEYLVERLRDDCCFEEDCCDSIDFMLEQLLLIIKNSKGRRYSSKCMMIALSLFLSSRKTYMKLREYLALPSPKTITQNIGSYSSIGGEEAATRISSLFFSHNNIQNPYCILIYDEMHLKPSLRYRGGHVIGYSLDQPEKLARTVLVYMVKLPFQPKPNSFVLRIIPVHTLTSELLFCETISQLKIISSAGGKTLSLISDNLATNRKLYEILQVHYPSSFSYKIPHPVDEGNDLYLLFDSVHLIKSIRNNWITEKNKEISFIPPDKTVEDQVIARWQDVIDLYKSESQNPLKRVNLTSAAVDPSIFDRQKVSLALQVFNDKTIAALSQDGKEDTACFIFFINRMWKMLNNKSTTAYIHLNDNDRMPLRDNNRKQLDFLKSLVCSFKLMPTGRGKNRNLSFTSETKKSLIQTIDGLVDMTLFLLNAKVVRFVLLGVFQSDILEGYRVWSYKGNVWWHVPCGFRTSPCSIKIQAVEVIL